MSQGNVRISNGLIPPVNLTDLATQTQTTIVGRVAGAGTGTPSALTASQVKQFLALVCNYKNSIRTLRLMIR